MLPSAIVYKLIFPISNWFAGSSRSPRRLGGGQPALLSDISRWDYARCLALSCLSKKSLYQSSLALTARKNSALATARSPHPAERDFAPSLFSRPAATFTKSNTTTVVHFFRRQDSLNGNRRVFCLEYKITKVNR